MRTIRNCEVCVVGGAGFLGSHLVNHLVDDRNCRVLVVDNLVAGRREFVHPEAEFVHHDITGSEEFLVKLFEEKKVKYVFQYAAYPYVPDSFARPLRVCDVNFMGAVKVVNAAQEAGCEAVLQVSSAEIYGDDGTMKEWSSGNGWREQPRSINEEGRVNPHSSYGAAKAAVDSYCQVAWRERKTPVIALRQFNCLGERETHPYVVPEIIGQLQQFKFGWPSCGKRATVKLGNDSFRDFLYAGDAVRIAVELLERGDFGEVYNLGSETGTKMYDLARLVGELMGFEDVRVELDQSRVRPWEIWHLQSDNLKLWKAVQDSTSLKWDMDHSWILTSFKEALKKTIAYYESNGRKWCWEK